GSLPEIPIRDVVSVMTKNLDLGEKPRDQVHPLLIDEKAARRIDDAMKFELPLPPLQKIRKHRAARDCEKAEVVGAGDENRPLARVVFAADRASEMRRQYDEVFSLIELKKRGVENDVGIEIDDTVIALL